MYSRRVYVPASLFLDRKLLPSTKLVWLTLFPNQGMELSKLLSPSRLTSDTGLTRPTIRQAIAQLTSQGWIMPTKRNKHLGFRETTGKRVYMVVGLIKDTSLSAQARLFYGHLQLTPGFHQNTKKCSSRFSTLSQQLFLDPKTVRRACFDLQRTDWVIMRQRDRLAPISFKLSSPPQTLKLRIETMLNKAEFGGEALARGWLSLLVPSRDFIDEGSHDYVRNPVTGMALRYDRIYLTERVAIEFNGAQHGRTTDLYGAEVVRKQKQRDRHKASLSSQTDITVMTISPEELSLEVLTEKLKGILPLRNLEGFESVVSLLERRSESYKQVTFQNTRQGRR